MKRCFSLLCFAAVLLSSVMSLRAQETRGQILGRVTDQSGKLLSLTIQTQAILTK